MYATSSKGVSNKVGLSRYIFVISDGFGRDIPCSFDNDAPTETNLCDRLSFAGEQSQQTCLDC